MSQIRIDRDGAVGFLAMERRERFNAADELSRLADTADLAQGIQAFFEKRPLRFEGK